MVAVVHAGVAATTGATASRMDANASAVPAPGRRVETAVRRISGIIQAPFTFAPSG
jgi:hypothetical protein